MRTTSFNRPVTPKKNAVWKKPRLPKTRALDPHKFRRKTPITLAGRTIKSEG